jgi:origin recognition complex subunit 1
MKGVTRDDSDDELGDEDFPWEWIYSDDDAHLPKGEANSRKRKRTAHHRIIGARMGDFECRLGDTVLLKADGSNEAWVAIVCEFIDDDGDDGEKAANFMWFSTAQEIRNKERKRSDNLPVRCIVHVFRRCRLT